MPIDTTEPHFRWSKHCTHCLAPFLRSPSLPPRLPSLVTVAKANGWSFQHSVRETVAFMLQVSSLVIPLSLSVESLMGRCLS